MLPALVGESSAGTPPDHCSYVRILFRGKGTPLTSTLLCLSARVGSDAATAGPMRPNMELDENRGPSHRGHGRPAHPPRHRTHAPGNLSLPHAPVLNPTDCSVVFFCGHPSSSDGCACVQDWVREAAHAPWHHPPRCARMPWPLAWGAGRCLGPSQEQECTRHPGK